jgi:hypothetical protein
MLESVSEAVKAHEKGKEKRDDELEEALGLASSSEVSGISPLLLPPKRRCSGLGSRGLSLRVRVELLT